MTTIKEVRAAIDAGLDRLQAKAEAAAAQLNLSEDEIDARIAEYENHLKSAATALQTRMAEAEEVAGETKTKIQSALEHLQVQLALGKADTRDALRAKKKEIQHAIAEFNAELDAADAAEEREMAAEFDSFVKAYVEQAAALEAELEALEETYEKQEG